MSDPFVGELKMVGFNFAPRGWATCDGQLMPIGQNQALFSLLGTLYGGDGQTTFALPDLRGRVPLGFSASHPQGEAGGEATHALTVAEMPAHGHSASSATAAGTQASPANNVWAQDSGGNAMFAAAANATLAPGAIAAAGGSQPHDNMQPCQVVNWVIALEGVYPSRN